MIIKKNTDGTYLCEVDGSYYNIDSKDNYLQQKAETESIIKPTNAELIELGKQSHPYFQKDNVLANINNQLLEIEEFENGGNNII